MAINGKIIFICVTLDQDLKYNPTMPYKVMTFYQNSFGSFLKSPDSWTQSMEITVLIDLRWGLWINQDSLNCKWQNPNSNWLKPHHHQKKRAIYWLTYLNSSEG